MHALLFDFAKSLGDNLADLDLIRPELFLAMTFLVAFVYDLFAEKTAKRLVGFLCLFGAIASFVLTMSVESSAMTAYSGNIFIDSFSHYFRFLCYGTLALALVVAISSKSIRTPREGEFYYLMVATGLGMVFLSMANSLLMIYLSLEMLSLMCYVLAGYQKRDRKSSEAGFKYVIYGALASGTMIYGMAHLYGVTHTLELDKVIEALTRMLAHGEIAWWQVLVLALMLFAGLAYKIAAFPFHMWSPDVYEGAPTAATAFFSVGPKVAGFAIMVRVFFLLRTAFDDPALANSEEIKTLSFWLARIFVIVAFSTMTIGNLAALAQNNVKRLLAYSSIAHSGYILAAFVVIAPTAFGEGAAYFGLEAVLLYLLVYVFMNLGAFYALVCIENKIGSTDLGDLRGAATYAPFLSVTMAISLFALVGLPPLSGFIGKFFVFRALLDPYTGGSEGTQSSILLFLAFAIAVNSVIALFYYVRVLKTMVVDAPSELTKQSAIRMPQGYAFVSLVFAVPTLLLGIFWNPASEIVSDVRIEVGAPADAGNTATAAANAVGEIASADDASASEDAD
ncbi:MAG: NADH-quinone oxidoreductase subunit N [Planctomycetes bacterium]|nr:NADH-quinone oxidoreductase subunit N [Planctomycetota bacterium]